MAQQLPLPLPPADDELQLEVPHGIDVETLTTTFCPIEDLKPKTEPKSVRASVCIGNCAVCRYCNA